MSLRDWFRNWGTPKRVEQQREFNNALVAAAEMDDIPKMTEALKNGADVNWRDNLHRTSLHIAAEEPDSDAVKLLLENKADVTSLNRFDQTALHLGLRKGADMTMITGLLNAGNPVNGKDTHGCTPGFYAARNGNTEAIALLGEKCADLTIADNNGTTPLMAATSFWHNETAKALTRLPYMLDAQDKSGMTALMFAAITGNTGLVKHFLTLGADFSLKNKWGQTALTAAREQKPDSEAARLLEQAEAALIAPLTGGSENAFRAMKPLALAPRKGLAT